ncbi:hypothetical protein EIP91_009271 [Steccherinum ochraceum]|uniref:Uncharacterized protein n=1 Tax=Steccherinum ochraceum TaxID=92696 RepID=A0A4V2MV37_9APHY|nr:hypothetical protein EIP91_009271 [Steccherinum ochraceum]
MQLLPTVQLPGVEPVDASDPFGVLYRRLWSSSATAESMGYPLYHDLQVPSLENPTRTTPLKASFFDLEPLRPGKFLLRQEYHALKEIVDHCFATFTDAWAREGVWVTGHSRIGKSTFLYFLLHEYLVQGQACILQTSPVQGYLFGPRGVYLLDLETARMDLEDSLVKIGAPAKIIVLVDSHQVPGKPHFRFTSSHYQRKYLVVLSDGPREKYRDWVRYQNVYKLYMREWEWEDVYAAGTILYQKSSEELAKAFNEFGRIGDRCFLPPAFDEARKGVLESAPYMAQIALTDSLWAVLRHTHDLDIFPPLLFSPFSIFLLTCNRQNRSIDQVLFLTKSIAYEFYRALAGVAKDVREIGRFYGVLSSWGYNERSPMADQLYEMVAHSHLAEGMELSLKPLRKRGRKLQVVFGPGPVMFVHLVQTGCEIPEERYCILHSSSSGTGNSPTLDSLCIHKGVVYLFKIVRDSSHPIDLSALDHLRTVLGDELSPERKPWRIVFVVPRGMARNFRAQRLVRSEDASMEDVDDRWKDLLLQYVTEFDMARVGAKNP